MPDDRLHHQKQRESPQQHVPAWIDRNGQREREGSSNDRTYVGDKAEYACQDAPQDGAWNADQPQTDSDHQAKRSVQEKLDQEEPAEAPRGVVDRSRRSLQVMRTSEPYQSVTQIFTLKQNENDKDDDNTGGSQRVKEGGDQGLQTFKCAGIRLTHFHRNRRERRGLDTQRRRRVFRFVQLLAEVLQHPGGAFQ